VNINVTRKDDVTLEVVEIQK